VTQHPGPCTTLGFSCKILVTGRTRRNTHSHFLSFTPTSYTIHTHSKVGNPSLNRILDIFLLVEEDLLPRGHSLAMADLLLVCLPWKRLFKPPQQSKIRCWESKLAGCDMRANTLNTQRQTDNCSEMLPRMSRLSHHCTYGGEFVLSFCIFLLRSRYLVDWEAGRGHGASHSLSPQRRDRESD
jgi:hypothetical protein